MANTDISSAVGRQFIEYSIRFETLNTQYNMLLAKHKEVLDELMALKKEQDAATDTKVQKRTKD